MITLSDKGYCGPWDGLQLATTLWQQLWSPCVWRQWQPGSF